jgi:iron complex transport system ATP-binding protein
MARTAGHISRRQFDVLATQWRYLRFGKVQTILTGPLIELRNVGYCAGEVSILDRVSWQVEVGEHWAILGPNGAGKTTLLKIACGYLWPNAGGAVLRRGQQLLDLRELRRSMGWVSSRLAGQIPPHERARDTAVSGCVAQVGLKPTLRGPRPSSEDYDRAAQFLRDLDCDHIADRQFGVLSQGEQQKVMIARALMSLPLLIFLDEPCAGLDPGARERLLASLGQLATNCAVPSLILVTHHIEEIMPAFQKVLVMREGRIAATGDMQEVVDIALLESLYEVKIKSLDRNNGRLWPMF